MWRDTGQKPLECLLSRAATIISAIELLHAFIRQIVHPLTAATFGDWLSPRGQVQYHKFRTITIGQCKSPSVRKTRGPSHVKRRSLKAFHVEATLSHHSQMATYTTGQETAVIHALLFYIGWG